MDETNSALDKIVDKVRNEIILAIIIFLFLICAIFVFYILSNNNNYILYSLLPIWLVALILVLGDIIYHNYFIKKCKRNKQGICILIRTSSKKKYKYIKEQLYQDFYQAFHNSNDIFPYFLEFEDLKKVEMLTDIEILEKTRCKVLLYVKINNNNKIVISMVTNNLNLQFVKAALTGSTFISSLNYSIDNSFFITKYDSSNLFILTNFIYSYIDAHNGNYISAIKTLKNILNKYPKLYYRLVNKINTIISFLYYHLLSDTYLKYMDAHNDIFLIDCNNYLSELKDLSANNPTLLEIQGAISFFNNDNSSLYLDYLTNYKKDYSFNNDIDKLYSYLFFSSLKNIDETKLIKLCVTNSKKKEKEKKYAENLKRWISFIENYISNINPNCAILFLFLALIYLELDDQYNFDDNVNKYLSTANKNDLNINSTKILERAYNIVL